MTLTQRLTRAGATFIVFGIAAAFLPTNSNAFSATDGCTVDGHRDYVGTYQGDTRTSYLFIVGANTADALTLTGYSESGATITSISPGGTGFINTFVSATPFTRQTVVMTRTTGTGPDNVTVTFSDGHVVAYSVS